LLSPSGQAEHEQPGDDAHGVIDILAERQLGGAAVDGVISRFS
jgi:hypothetical protein